MGEVKTCPFHKRPIDPVLYTGYDEGNGSPESGGWWATVECPECDSVSMSEIECPTEEQAIEEVRTRWNTRAERTCHPVQKFSEGSPWPYLACSECGRSLHWDDIVNEVGDDSCELQPYCGCGARVVKP